MRFRYLLLVGFAYSIVIGQLNIPKPDEIVSVSVFLSQDKIHPGESFYIALKCKILKGWHINANVVESDFSIPTRVMFDPISGISFGEQVFPSPEWKKFAFTDEKIPVFEKEITVFTSAAIITDFPSGKSLLKGKVTYQACDDRMCLPPAEVPWQVDLNIVEKGVSVQEVNQDIFSLMRVDSREDSSDDSGDIGKWMRKRGLFFTFILVFIGGLALNLTPCVYPLIPITVSYFGNQATGKLSKSFMLAVFYVLGMALTYSILGTVAASTGSILGSAMQKPVVLIFIAFVLIVLSLSMFGLYEIRVPQSLASIGGKSREGIIGSLFMGLTVGLIAAPCIGPFVISLLVFVGETGNPFLGFWLFFVLALGLGLPFLILGTFSGIVSSLPRSGVWMVWVRKLFGIILIGMAFYFIQTLLPKQVYKSLLVLLLFGSGVYLGWLEKSSGGKIFRSVRWTLGGVVLLSALWMAIPKVQHSEIEWQPFEYSLLEKAKIEQKPVILDFFADWCIPCKELDLKTFSDGQVVNYSGRFLTLKVDLTKEEDTFVKRVKQDFQIKGVPTIVFIDKDGNEIKELRFFGFIDADDFLEKMKRVE